MIVEANTVRSDTKRRRLAHIVQQRAPGKGRRTRVGHMVEQQQRVHEHIALWMELRGLLHSFHR